MLEIFILIGIARGIGGIAERKGRAKLGYQFMGVGFWILGEVLGAVGGLILSHGAGNPGCMVYICALVGAVAGAGIAFAIVSSLPPVQREDEFYRGGRGDDLYRREFSRDDFKRGNAGPSGRDRDERRPLADDDDITDRPGEREEDDRFQK
jgi:hypothetical protein